MDYFHVLIGSFSMLMIFKFLHIVLLASVKYILTLPYAMIIGMEYKEALPAVLLGGIGGFLFFYYISQRFVNPLDYLLMLFCKITPTVFKNRFNTQCDRKKSKKRIKVFSRRTRFIARFKNSYGFWGIIVTTPVFLTIPLGAFLISKYYSRRPYILLYVIISIVAWTGVLTGIVHLFPKVFF